MSELFRCLNCGDVRGIPVAELQIFGDPYCGPCDGEPFSPHEMERV